MSETIDFATAYIATGWRLCRILPRTKRPQGDDWAAPTMVIDTPEKARTMLPEGYGVGIVHSQSRTCAIDVDDLEAFNAILAEFGLDMSTLFAGAPRVRGRPGRAKALFRVPAGTELGRKALTWPPRQPGGKPITVFELRAGDTQDVLPPTIHPDLGRAYEWEPGAAPWDLAEIPVLPGVLLAMWRDWDKLKPQMTAVCPWAPKAQPVAPSAPRAPGPGGKVIEAFNAAHDAIAILEAHGYEKRGRRWLSPTSSTGLAGVVRLEDGRVYSHHASDPLCDGHAHDAFDAFRILEHGGDARIAAREAAKVLGLPPIERAPVEMDESTNAVIASGRARRGGRAKEEPRKPDVEPAPEHLLRLPGPLGEFAAWATATAPRPQPLFSVGAALALGSVALARRWTTDLRTYSSLYLLHVGKSASGKEQARQSIEAALGAAGLGHLIGPAGYASDSAVMSALLLQPAHVAIVDELGELLRNSKSEGNYAKRQAMVSLMEAWGRLGGTMRSQGYSTASLTQEQAKAMKERVVERPGITLVGMSTPETFYEALDEGSIKGGFLNRLLVLETHIGRQTFNPSYQDLPVPGYVAEWLRAVRAPAGGNLESIDAATGCPPPRVVPIAAGALRAWRDYEAECIGMQDRLDAEGLAELYGRSAEQALRVALVLAVADSVEAPTIRAEHVEWARDLVSFSTRQVVASARSRMHASPFGKLVADIARLIEQAGHAGLTRRDLDKASRAWRGLTPQRQREVEESLIQAGRARWVDIKPPGSGRPRKALVALDEGGADGTE